MGSNAAQSTTTIAIERATRRRVDRRSSTCASTLPFIGLKTRSL